MPPKSSRKSSPSWLWLVPLAGLTGFAANRFLSEPAPPEPAPMQVKVPIEVVRPGQPTEIIYIEVQEGSLPNPSAEGVRPAARSASIPAR